MRFSRRGGRIELPKNRKKKVQWVLVSIGLNKDFYLGKKSRVKEKVSSSVSVCPHLPWSRHRAI